MAQRSFARRSAPLVTSVAGLSLLVACTSSGQNTGSGSTGDPQTGTAGLAGPALQAAGRTTSGMVLAADDLPVPGLTLTSTAALPGIQGRVARFASTDGATVLGDTVVVYSTPAEAKTALAAAAATAAATLDGAQVRELVAPAGDTEFSGSAYSGFENAGSAAQRTAATAVFVEGRAFVTMTLTSSGTAPVDGTVIDALVHEQDAVLRSLVG
jgi:hypothetical protein